MMSGDEETLCTTAAAVASVFVFTRGPAAMALNGALAPPNLSPMAPV